MRLNKFVFLALFALVCFASQLRADVPPIIWYKTFGGSINTLNLHPSGEKLLISAIQSEEGFNTVVVSADSGNIIKSYPLKHADEIQEWSKYSKSGKYTVFGGEYNGGSYSFIRVVDNDADTVVFDKEWNYSFLRSFDISPDETILALGGQGWLEFYDLASGVKTDSIPFFGYQSTPKFIGNISYSPNGIYLAYTNESDGALEIINASSHQKYISTASPKWYGRLRFSPNSKLLAFNSSLDNTAIEILNLDSMKVLDKVAGYVQSTADIVFTKDSKNILFTRLGSLGGLYIYYLNSKNILEIENASTYRFFQLSSNEKTSYLSIGDMVFKIDITSSMNVEHIPYSPLLTISINSSQDTLNLNFATTAGREFTIRIVNIEGQVVKTFSGYSTSDTFSGAYDISDLASGTYILSVQGSGINSSANFSIAR